MIEIISWWSYINSQQRYQNVINPLFTPQTPGPSNEPTYHSNRNAQRKYARSHMLINLIWFPESCVGSLGKQVNLMLESELMAQKLHTFKFNQVLILVFGEVSLEPWHIYHHFCSERLHAIFQKPWSAPSCRKAT